MSAADLFNLVLTKLIDAIPYLIGGVLALAGGFFTHRFTTKRERENYIRDRLAEYVHLVSEDLNWLDRYRNAFCFGDGQEPTEPAPWDRAFAISALYLTIPHETEFIAARGALYQAIGAVGTQRMQAVVEGNAAGLNVSHPDAQLLAAVTAAFQAYLQARSRLFLECRNLAARVRAA